VQSAEAKEDPDKYVDKAVMVWVRVLTYGIVVDETV